MRSFFDGLNSHRWTRPGASRLHVHALPVGEHGRQVRELATAYRPSLDQFTGCLTPIPPQWLHMTIVGLGYTQDSTPARIATMTDDLRAAAAALAPIEVTVGRAAVHPASVCCLVWPGDPVRAAVDAVLDATSPAPGTALLSNPWSAHMGLAYGIADDPDVDLQAIETITDRDTPQALWRIEELYLVDQVQHPHVGTFTWTTVATLPLRG